jgi:hypothetical protein
MKHIKSFWQLNEEFSYLSENQTNIELLTEKPIQPTSSAPEKVNFRIFKDGRFQYQIGENDQGKGLYSPLIRLSYGVSDSQYTVKITDIEPNRVKGRIKPPREQGSSVDPGETGEMYLNFNPEVVWRGLNDFIKAKPQKDTYKEIGYIKKREMTDLRKYGGENKMVVVTYPLLWTIT